MPLYRRSHLDGIGLLHFGLLIRWHRIDEIFDIPFNFFLIWFENQLGSQLVLLFPSNPRAFCCWGLCWPQGSGLRTGKDWLRIAGKAAYPIEQSRIAF